MYIGAELSIIIIKKIKSHQLRKIKQRGLYCIYKFLRALINFRHCCKQKFSSEIHRSFFEQIFFLRS